MPSGAKPPPIDTAANNTDPKDTTTTTITNGETAHGDASAPPHAGETSSEFTTAVDELLEQMRARFTAVSDEMLGKMDEMSRRIDGLEASMRVQQAQQSGGSQGKDGAGPGAWK